MPRKKKTQDDRSSRVVTDQRRDPLNTAQVAQMFQVSRMTLEYWLENDQIPTPQKNPKNGALLWTQKDIDALDAYIRQKGVA
jgi:DNA-binding transcriptional MerR regulator